MSFFEINDDLRQDAVTFSSVTFGGDLVVSRGQVHHLKDLNGFVFIENNKIMASIFYDINNQECEIVFLESKLEGRGIGGQLIQYVVDKGKLLNCRRVWLITSNDNVKAIRFYQKRGFDLVSIHRNAITEARKLKPSIPMFGFDDIAIKHEVEFEFVIS